MSDAKVENIKVTAREAPDSMVFVPDVDLAKVIPNPGLPRATITATREHPQGVPRPKGAPDNTERTVLQQHVDFWDENRDGYITMGETWRGFRKLGYNWFWCVLAVLLIHGTMSFATHDTWKGALSMSIHIKNINRAHHGSDSGIIDREGRFIPQKFEDIFTSMDRDKKGGLTFQEACSFIRHNRDAWDVYGWLAAIFEWGFLYMLAADKNGILSKEVIRGQYDGSLFYKIAEQNAQSAKQKSEAAQQSKTLKQKASQAAQQTKQQVKQTVEHVHAAAIASFKTD